ncbi:uncharacterized protein LOC113147382 [Cyclospora cayetanensis]|uniref:Uncharacterized protein LOC113147382 n=1 Tax=Cyclospora cayetanensis TaxID=88456 RepID=A0A6P6S2M9_9EIME|nr:uncharacterized protein LOC113147382 [Cyclospora cayetanensis]
MLNPDGVIGGMSRCGLHGTDLNRVWEAPCPVLHPSIFFLKQILAELRRTATPPLLFLDLHAHSSKKDVFIYANSADQQLNPEGFSAGDGGLACITKIQKCKEGTGRVVGFRELGIACSYTLEASVFGHAQASPKQWAAALSRSPETRCAPQHIEEGNHRCLQKPRYSQADSGTTRTPKEQLPGCPPAGTSREAPPDAAPAGRLVEGASPLMHFEAGSLLLTGLTVGLALYDWSLQLAKGAPELLQPGRAAPAGEKGCPSRGLLPACPRCALVRNRGSCKAASPGNGCRGLGGIRHRGPSSRRHVSAALRRCEVWESSRDALLVGVPYHSYENSVRSFIGPSSECGSFVEGDLCEGEAATKGLRPLPTAGEAARKAMSAVRRSLKVFAAKASPAEDIPHDILSGWPRQKLPPRLTNGMVRLDTDEFLNTHGEPLQIFSKGEEVAPHRTRAAEQRPCTSPYEESASSAVTGSARNGNNRDTFSSDGLKTSTGLGAPKGPTQFVRKGALGFRGYSKASAARLRLRLRQKEDPWICKSTLYNTSDESVQAAFSSCPKKCCEIGHIDPKLVAIPLHRTSVEAHHPSSSPNNMNDLQMSHVVTGQLDIACSMPRSSMQRRQHRSMQAEKKTRPKGHRKRWGTHIRAAETHLNGTHPGESLLQGRSKCGIPTASSTGSTGGLGVSQASESPLRASSTGKAPGTSARCNGGGPRCFSSKLEESAEMTNSSAPKESLLGSCSAPSYFSLGSPYERQRPEGIINQGCSKRILRRATSNLGTSVLPASAAFPSNCNRSFVAASRAQLNAWGPWEEEGPRRGFVGLESALSANSLSITRVTPAARPRRPNRWAEFPPGVSCQGESAALGTP